MEEAGSLASSSGGGREEERSRVLRLCLCAHPPSGPSHGVCVYVCVCVNESWLPGGHKEREKEPEYNTWHSNFFFSHFFIMVKYKVYHLNHF